MEPTQQLAKTANRVVGNAKAELDYANSSGDMIALREGSKLFQGAAGPVARTALSAGRMLGGIALVAGGIRTATSLVNSLQRGEGFAALIPKGK